MSLCFINVFIFYAFYIYVVHFLYCPVDYPTHLYARVQYIAACEIVIIGQSRISVSEHLPSLLEPALSDASPGDVR